MAFDDDIDEEVPAAVSKPSKRSPLLPIALSLFLLTAAIGAYFLLTPDEKVVVPSGISEILIEDPDGVLPGATLILNPFTVNLGSPERFLRLGVGLEFFDLSLPEQLEIRRGAIRDRILSLSAQKEPDELLTPDGKEEFRKELLVEINKIDFGENYVVEIYFTEFLVQ